MYWKGKEWALLEWWFEGYWSDISGDIWLRKLTILRPWKFAQNRKIFKNRENIQYLIKRLENFQKSSSIPLLPATVLVFDKNVYLIFYDFLKCPIKMAAKSASRPSKNISSKNSENKTLLNLCQLLLIIATQGLYTSKVSTILNLLILPTSVDIYWQPLLREPW